MREMDEYLTHTRPDRRSLSNSKLANPITLFIICPFLPFDANFDRFEALVTDFKIYCIHTITMRGESHPRKVCPIRE